MCIIMYLYFDIITDTMILQSQPEAIECLQLHLSHRLKLYPTHT